MLFMNISRKFGAVYCEEAGNDGAAGGGGPAAETVDPVKAAEVKAEVPAEPSKEPAAEPHAMDQYIEQYSADNPALSVALGFLKDNGISPTDPAFQLAENEGDFTLLKALLAKSGAPGTDAMVAILEGAVQEHFDAIAEHDAATEATVTEIMGDNKDAILEWARANADEGEKKAINEMFEAGGVYARAAAMMLNHAYSSAPDVTRKAANPVRANIPVGAGTPLSAREYAAEVDKLYKKMGNNDPRGTPEYKELSARRAAARARGL
ncbi:putative scaffolding protein [Aeromonas phage Atoyac15]|uniref:Putative scaffolding protein n=1 Tax=Aeromonas phage Atoyac15 TaxID=2767551 RepID=A0A866D206_9CAUD|nr:putative scaffolding protein [Aeromonas phage Atoyac15]